MKKILVILIMLILSAMPLSAFAAPSWDVGASETHIVESATSSPKVAEAKMPAYGYIGDMTQAGIDVDGDGKIDIKADAKDIIDVSIPLEIPLAAGTGTTEGKFISPMVAVINNNPSGSVGVTMMGFVAKQATGIKLATTQSGLGEHDLALKVSPVNSANPFSGFLESYAGSIVPGNEIRMGTLYAGDTGYFTFKASYTDAFNNAHAGDETGRYAAIFKIEAA